MRIALSTMANPGLLQPAGQVRAMGEALNTIALKENETLPDRVTMDLLFQKEEEPPVNKMKNLLNSFAGMLSSENKNLFQRMKTAAIKKMIGFKDKVPKIDLEYDPETPKQVSLNMDIQGISRNELNKFSVFLKNNADYLAKEY
jgi:hypothetical protein